MKLDEMHSGRGGGGTMNSTTVEGVTVSVGDWVGFKSDIEQSGKIIKISRSTYGITLTLSNPNGFEGDYIGGETTTTISTNDAWVE